LKSQDADERAFMRVAVSAFSIIAANRRTGPAYYDDPVGAAFSSNVVGDSAR
jgi:hypothetical protein